jgi:glycosyltransferase involved in cell wall biosynthesis
MKKSLTTSKNPPVSVIVLTYNHELYIASCIKSILSIDYESIELIILDDGSDDATFKIVSSFNSTENCRLSAHTQPQSGGKISENSQKLLGMATGKYVLFLSGDDALCPDFDLKRIVALMENAPNTVMALTRAFHVVVDDCCESINIYTQDFRDQLLSGEPEVIFRGHLCKRVSRLFLQGTVIRRDFCERFGGFDTSKVADDYAFMTKAFTTMIILGQNFKFFEDIFWIYRVHKRNIHTDQYRQRQLVFEVVAEYVPKDCWPYFQWDHEEPNDFIEYRKLQDQLIKYFSDTARTHINPRLQDRFLYKAIQRKDVHSILSIIKSTDLKARAILFVLLRLHRFIKPAP